MADTGPVRRRRESPMTRFLAYLVEIEGALMRRDALRVTALLRKRTATHMPREVREELLAISRAPRDSLRAPVQFLRFQHRMNQLALGGEKLPTAQRELRLTPRATSGAIRRDERVAASRDHARGVRPADNRIGGSADDDMNVPPDEAGA